MVMHVGSVHPGERAIVIDERIVTGDTLFGAAKLLGKLVNINVL